MLMHLCDISVQRTKAAKQASCALIRFVLFVLLSSLSVVQCGLATLSFKSNVFYFVFLPM